MSELAEMVRASRRLDRLRLVGAVVLTVGIVLTDNRQSEWAAFARFLIAAVPCLVLFMLALSLARPGQALETWQTTLMICGLVLLLLSLVELADVLGVEAGRLPSGTGFWVTGVVTAAAATVAIKFRSPVHMLFAALFGIVAFLFFVRWTTGELSLHTTRDLLVFFAFGYAGGAYALRRSWPELGRLGADYLVLVAGLAGVTAGTLGIGTLGGVADFFLSRGFFGHSHDGWELFLLAVSVLLIYYTVWQGYRATAYLGAYGLITFVTVVGGGGIGGWPLLLTIVGAAAVAASLLGRQLGVTARGSDPPPPPDLI